MRDFWRLLQVGILPKHHAHVWEKAVARDTLAVLKREGILFSDEPAGWYPCGGSDGLGCSRRVFRAPEHGDGAFLAICGQEEDMCESLVVRAPDLELVTVSRPRLEAVLCELLGIEPQVLPNPPAYQTITPLGVCYPAGRYTEVFLSRKNTVLVPAFLAHRRTLRVHTIVLSPTSKHLTVDVVQQYTIAGDKVELQFLDQLVVLRDGKLVLASEPATRPKETLAPYCRVFDGAPRLATEAEYRAILAGEHGHALIADLTTVVGRGYAAYVLTAEGLEQRRLSREQAALLAELMEAGRPLEAREFKSISANRRVEMFEHLRRAVDVKLTSSKHSYRSFHTIPGADANTYQFRPPAGFRYAVLRLPTLPT